MNLYALVLLLIFSHFKSCVDKSTSIPVEHSYASTENEVDDEKDINLYKLPYDLGNYDQVYSVSRKLLEISALAYDVETNQLVTLNDELGKIFLLNPKDGSINSEFKFEKNGDYEGVEIVGDEIIALKSNGTVYRIDRASQETTKIIKTQLKYTNDTEGLGYNPQNQTLLIACKGKGEITKSNAKKNSKSIYAFSLEGDSLFQKPLFSIKDKTIEKVVAKEPIFKNLSKKEREKQMLKAKRFSPSAIAVHPKDHNYYILSAQGNTLMIFNQEYDLVGVHFLESNIHRQPEGICFTPDGGMFISNEGSGLSAKIYYYAYKGR